MNVKLKLTESTVLFSVPLIGYALVYGYSRGQASFLSLPSELNSVFDPQTIVEIAIPGLAIVMTITLIFLGLRVLVAKAGPISRVVLAISVSGIVVLPFMLMMPFGHRYSWIVYATLLVLAIAWQLVKPLFKGGLKNYRTRLDAEWRSVPNDMSDMERFLFIGFMFLGAFMFAEITGQISAASRIDYSYYCEQEDTVVVRRYAKGLVIAQMDVKTRTLRPEYQWIELAVASPKICAGKIGPLTIAGEQRGSDVSAETSSIIHCRKRS